MKTIITLLCLTFFSVTARSQSIYFPPNGATNQWDSTSINSLGWCQDKLDTLLNYLEAENTKAFLVLKDGKIVVEKYFGTFTMDSVWYWASAGKSLTSFLVGLAQQDGFLSTQDTTSDYLGTGWTIAPPNKELMITIKNQLSMTSGLDDGVPDHHCTLDTCLAYLADASTRWAYHNGPYTLLDSVMENATSVSLNTYMNQKVKITTGMTGLFVPSGFNNVFYSKARSMARFGLLVLNKGKWNTTTIMSDTSYFNQMTNSSQALNPSYGYLWWLNGKSSYMLPGVQFTFNGPLSPNAPSDMIAAMGKNGQFLNIVPSQNLVWVRMGNEPGGSEVPAFLNDSIWLRLNAVMCTPNNLTQLESSPATKLFPNPTSTSFQIQTSFSLYELSLFDMFGRKALSISNLTGNTTIPLPELTTGIYVVQLHQNGQRVFQEKVTIIR